MAFKLPNFSDVFAEGAFNAAFVPLSGSYLRFVAALVKEKSALLLFSLTDLSCSLKFYTIRFLVCTRI